MWKRNFTPKEIEDLTGQSQPADATLNSLPARTRKKAIHTYQWCWWRDNRIKTFWVCVIITACCMLYLFIQGYRLDRDIDSLMDRAQVGADAVDILEYMKQLEDNMRYWEMTEGHTALILRNPRNDMALHYKAVRRIINRLTDTKDLPRNETTYQVALDDIRGTIRELPDPAMGWLWVQYVWWIALLLIVLWVPPILWEKKYYP